MRSYLSARDIFIVLLCDCILVQAFDYDVVVTQGDMSELKCSAVEMLLSFECKCKESDIEEVIFGRYVNDKNAPVPLAKLTKNATLEVSSAMIAHIYHNLEWMFNFGSHDITAWHYYTTSEMAGLYSCSIIVLIDTEEIVYNSTLFLIVKDPLPHIQLPMDVINFAYEILAFLVALTVFCTLFVLICLCTEEKTSVKEKRQKFYRWKMQRKEIKISSKASKVFRTKSEGS